MAVGLASARGQLRRGAGEACRGAAPDAARRDVRQRHRVQLGWTELSARQARAGDRRDQPAQGSDPAVSFYTHVSDRYAPFHSRVISAGAGEAAHVLDGLLHHGADLAIERHHTFGGGVSDHVFALCHLLGFRFAPRIPNIAARRLHLFADTRPGPDIAPLAAQPIDEALIAGHWTDVIRLATSIRTGVTSASVMLERLGSCPRAKGLALALREVGRVERTLFTLDWGTGERMVENVR
ncbi:transposase (fragment) [Sphingomonas sp. 8AM]